MSAFSPARSPGSPPAGAPVSFPWRQSSGREATCLLIGERYLRLPRARLQARVEGDEVELSADAFAYQVTLEVPGVTGAVFEDNYFDLPPGGKRAVALVDAAGGRKIQVQALNAPAVEIEID